MLEVRCKSYGITNMGTIQLTNKDKMLVLQTQLT